MLTVTTVQLYNAAFAMPIPHTYPAPLQAPLSDSGHHFLHAAANDVTRCCEQPDSLDSTHCDQPDNSCDHHDICAQSNCVSSIGYAPAQYLFALDTPVIASLTVTKLLLPQQSGSLYRPPISH
ncbi:hypothetical protein [Amphritea pacifica]|uniref:Uncharacterized protein n=1 Tax=Amphritea pacifica TaxID=2811233 RepID=A0ABS2W5U4_9GAMM|nr:hypothetical protein [Amphritea pacifica]MBN0987084.1 hypothetical protein [Amphritea pacifica]